MSDLTKLITSLQSEGYTVASVNDDPVSEDIEEIVEAIETAGSAHVKIRLTHENLRGYPWMLLRLGARQLITEMSPRLPSDIASSYHDETD